MNEQPSAPNPAPPANSDRHPSVDAWIAYYSGSVSDREQARMQEHLTRCRRCVDLVLDLEAFAEPAGEDRRQASEFERAAAWRALQPALRPRRWPAAAAMAASILVAIGSLSWAQQRRVIDGLEARAADLARPWANLVIQDLSPSSRQRSAGGADATTDLHPGGGAIALILNLEEPATHRGYEVRILDAGGQEIHRLRGLEASEFDNFYLALPPGSLANGSYELRLFGLDPGGEELLEIYPIEIH